MKILVTGYAGQLGFDVVKELKARRIECIGATRQDFDLENPGKIHSFLATHRPDAVIHCAAYTAVDKAEDEPALCKAINTTATEAMADACKEIGAKLLYISTDYVFPGKGSDFYTVEDQPGALGVYGKSKWLGETAVQTILDKYFIVRISWVFGKNGRNFVKTMLNLAREREEIKVVGDQIGSPTYTVDLAKLLCDMIVTEQYGIYHATNEGVCSWAEFAQEIVRQAGHSTKIVPIPSSEYPTRAVRPLNSRMDKTKLGEMGFQRLPNWQDAVKRYIKELGQP